MMQGEKHIRPVSHVERLLDPRSDGIAIEHVNDTAVDFDAMGIPYAVGGVFDPIRIAGTDREPAALRCERVRDGKTKALRRGRDDCPLAGEIEIHAARLVVLIRVNPREPGVPRLGDEGRAIGLAMGAAESIDRILPG